MDTASSDKIRHGQDGPGRWCFVGMELDETRGRLRVEGVEHPLDHGSFGVLQALLRQPGVVVGKEALLRAGWPGRVVSENSLTKAVGRLRHLLGDAEGELLCTAHGYGYRLAAPAEWRPEASPESASPASSPAAPAPPAAVEQRGSRRQLAMAALLFVLLVAGAWWLGQHRETTPAPLAAAGAPALNAPPVPDGASIAVLPFEDLSEKRDQRYFSDGLAEELLDRLAKLPQLRVASRTSSAALRDSDEGVQEIGRQLGVATVLEGSVRRDGDRVRITVQLINVRDGYHLWSESYDKRMTDLFAVQDDIARSVVSALQLRLLPDQQASVTRHRTKSQAAYEEFMTGQRFQYAGGADNDRRAIAHWEQAIALDPEFSTAYSALADVLGGDADWADSPAQVAEGKRRSLQMIDTAIALEPDQPFFYLQRADFLYYTAHDWRAARRDLDTAARLFRRRPSELLARETRLLAVLGKLEQAIVLDRAAAREDPRSSWAWAHLGYHLAAAGRPAEAHAPLARAAALSPEDDHIGFYDGLAWLLQGKPREAIAAFERSGSVFRLAGLAAAHFDAGDEAASKQALQMLVARHAPMGAYQVAQVHAWRGEADEAFRWLDRAGAQGDAGLAMLRFDPMLRRLHGDPRYQAWLLKLRLDDASVSAL